MMISEFIERTGFQPTTEEYRQIEELYYSFDGDKDEFCKWFLNDGGEKKIYEARARRIKHLEGMIEQQAKKHDEELAKLNGRIQDLQKQLDRELEWKPCDGGTNMEQTRYEELQSAGRTLTDERAKELIADECGFSPEKITIIHTVSTYEANKYHRMRKAATYERDPIYESSDWNYIRFNCAQFMYEFVNGELRFYSR